MDSRKAPGPDGMSPSFFQTFWNILGNDVGSACSKAQRYLLTGILKMLY